MSASSSKIAKILAYECLDSRGKPTIAVILELQNGVRGSAMVPSGASTGEYEAHELRDGDASRYRGMGTLLAVEKVNEKINAHLQGHDILELAALDRKLIELDGSENKSNLGANAILGVSLAAAHAGANFLGIPLFRHLGGINAKQLPTPLVNVINGGAHAHNSLDFQEFMIVPHASSTFFENIRVAVEVFDTLKKNLIKKGLSVGLGDEGGFSPELKSAAEALQCLAEAVTDAGYALGTDVSLALDVAASELFDQEKGCYILKKSTGDKLNAEELIKLYSDLAARFPIVSIEDGLDENDWEAWETMTAKLGDRIQLVGDDLFVTNTRRLAEGIQRGVANAILIKPNQIGTVTETFETIGMAHENAYRCIISHRSGETEDSSIADIAVACQAGQIKTGSVCRSERTAKYNRLLWIETFLAGESFVEHPFA